MASPLPGPCRHASPCREGSRGVRLSRALSKCARKKVVSKSCPPILAYLSRNRISGAPMLVGRMQQVHNVANSPSPGRHRITRSVQTEMCPAGIGVAASQHSASPDSKAGLGRLAWLSWPGLSPGVGGVPMLEEMRSNARTPSRLKLMQSCASPEARRAVAALLGAWHRQRG